MTLSKVVSSQQADAGKTRGSSLFGREQGEKNLQDQYNSQQADDAAGKAEKNDAQSFHSGPLSGKRSFVLKLWSKSSLCQRALLWPFGDPLRIGKVYPCVYSVKV